MLPEPPAALAEASRVLAPGGRIVLVEVHTAVFTDATMVPLVTGHAAAAHQLGAISRGQAEAWVSEQTRRAAGDRLMVAVPMFLAAATR
ncbi:MAG TPA: hypothetical protein VF657_06870 [Actinoplanes sp.]|jgi:ubiquinone/menaquinone biosynthesis C-methylase UbiE